MHSGYVTTNDGIHIFYKTGARANPSCSAMVGRSSADDWDTQMMFFLNRWYRVIAHDRRGHGRSTQTADATTWTITPATWRRSPRI
jgi:non-heme chloroperoxidase